jgi:hypothetical protein
MELDFDASEEIADYVSVPAGTYLCEISEVRPGVTRSGDARWSFRLVVAEGEFAGRHAAWDSLVFSTRGRARVRKVFGALGLPNRGRVDVEPGDLEGRRAFAQVRPAEFTSASGETIRRNEVPYDGYRPVPGTGEDEAPADGDKEEQMEVPF